MLYLKKNYNTSVTDCGSQPRTVSSNSYGLVFKVEGAFMGADIPLKIHGIPPKI